MWCDLMEKTTCIPNLIILSVLKGTVGYVKVRPPVVFPPVLNAQIEAQEADAPNRVVSADVNVTLLDENDNTPLFGSSKYEGKVFRNQTEGMLVVTVRTQRVDSLSKLGPQLGMFLRAMYDKSYSTVTTCPHSNKTINTLHNDSRMIYMIYQFLGRSNGPGCWSKWTGQV